MNTLDAIRQRRAIKHFDPAHQITKEETQELIDLAMQSPSSFNIQHWRLVNVTDKSLRTQLRAAAHDQAQVTDASLLFVIAVDIKLFKRRNVDKLWCAGFDLLDRGFTITDRNMQEPSSASCVSPVMLVTCPHVPSVSRQHLMLMEVSEEACCESSKVYISDFHITVIN